MSLTINFEKKENPNFLCLSRNPPSPKIVANTQTLKKRELERKRSEKRRGEEEGRRWWASLPPCRRVAVEGEEAANHSHRTEERARAQGRKEPPSSLPSRYSGLSHCRREDEGRPLLLSVKTPPLRIRAEARERGLRRRESHCPVAACAARSVALCYHEVAAVAALKGATVSPLSRVGGGVPSPCLHCHRRRQLLLLLVREERRKRCCE
ncbi:uncharacterized protein DS421_17g581250 [Arachis hypogaea]|nr:uncharacterized protein DS421_17g581250 [Arachis hypogaea]